MQAKTHLSVRVEINECDEAVSPPGGTPLLLQPFFVMALQHVDVCIEGPEISAML